MMKLILMLLIVIIMVWVDNKRYKALRKGLNERDKYENICINEKKRIKESIIKFTSAGPVKNLYVNDKLDSRNFLALYDCEYGIENDITYGNTLDIDTNTKSIQLIGYIELESRSDKEVHLKQLLVKDRYVRNRYATLMMKRFIEWARITKIYKITLFASASGSISQKDLIKFYGGFGFCIVNDDIENTECDNGAVMELDFTHE